jgi:hypothetical protein
MSLAIPTITYQAVDDLIVTLTGADGSATGAAANRLRLFNRWIRRGWDFHWWPGLCAIELRYYRPAWDAADTYTDGEELWYSDDDVSGYYEANQTTSAGESPVTAPTKWDEITDLDTYIAWEQSGQTAIGQVRAVLRDNPRETGGRVAIPFVLDDRGVTLAAETVPDSVYLDFRRRCPTWGGGTFDAAATYAAGAVKFYSSSTAGFEGDYYTCVTATSAGQDPEDTPAKWSKIEIPAFLADFVAAGVFSDLSVADTRAEHAATAWQHLADEQSKLEGQSGQFQRARMAFAY